MAKQCVLSDSSNAFQIFTNANKTEIERKNNNSETTSLAW